MITVDSGLLVILAVLATAIVVVWMVTPHECGYDRDAADDTVRQAYIDGYDEGKAGLDPDPHYVGES